MTTPNPPTIFPKIKVRESRKTINPRITECLVVLQSVFKIDGMKCPEVLVYIANTLFNQEWKVEEWKVEGSKEEETEDKRRKEYVMPSLRTIMRNVSDFALLNQKRAAQAVKEAGKQNKVVTYGTDDTVKAAGHTRWDVKTAHITIIDREKNRESFSSVFCENISHSGEKSAHIKNDIAKMAILTESSYEEMLSYMDFFMSDRASNVTKTLNALGIKEREPKAKM